MIVVLKNFLLFPNATWSHVGLVVVFFAGRAGWFQGLGSRVRF